MGDGIELQVGLLTWRLGTAPPDQTADQVQSGDQQTSGQPSPRSHRHQLRLSGQHKYHAAGKATIRMWVGPYLCIKYGSAHITYLGSEPIDSIYWNLLKESLGVLPD